MTMIQRNSFTIIAAASNLKCSIRHLSAFITIGGRTGTQNLHCCNNVCEVSSVGISPNTGTSSTAYFYQPAMSMKIMKMSDKPSLPYHIVVGLPALSPTMEVGTLSEWYKNEGDAFHAGDGLAKIETDKAAIDFEAQDDGVIAKILISANDGADGCVYIFKFLLCKEMLSDIRLTFTFLNLFFFCISVKNGILRSPSWYTHYDYGRRCCRRSCI